MPGEEGKHKGAAKKDTISEEDISTLLQRYSAKTVLALLQEVFHFADLKIDWKALVKKSSTGITNAREYQMLWRHLAYRNSLLEKIDEAEPLDDDSDLEFEVEAVPVVSKEASIEAAACVKVLIPSGSQVESCPANRSTVEAPLTINIPNDCASHAPPDKQQADHCIRGMNIIVPVFVRKQSLQAGPSPDDKVPAKKRRNAWTKEEDVELIAAVQKCGEGNWATILKGDFKHDRTASQLSQRWSIIRKSQAKYPGISKKSSNSTRSEERLAAQKAISLAIDMPMSRGLSAVFSGATQSSTPASSAAIAAPLSETPPLISDPQSVAQSQQAYKQATSQKGASIALNKPRNPPKKPSAPVTPSTCPSSSIQAAAFAAGGRLAAPSTAASLFKAAQSKAAVHIRPIGGTLPKSSGPGAKLLPGPNILVPFQNLTTSANQVQPVPTQPNSRIAVLRHGNQQGPERPESLSASICTPVLNQSAKFEIKPGKLAGTASQENDEAKCDSIISAIDVGELLIEEDADANAEMELDSAVQDHPTGFQVMDVDENDGHADDNPLNSQAPIDSNIGFFKPGSSEDQTVESKA